MENIIIILILLAIVGGIVWYLWRAKKSGAKCIGCPHSKQCGGNCSCGVKPNKKSKWAGFRLLAEPNKKRGRCCNQCCKSISFFARNLTFLTYLLIDVIGNFDSIFKKAYLLITFYYFVFCWLLDIIVVKYTSVYTFLRFRTIWYILIFTEKAYLFDKKTLSSRSKSKQI